MTGRTRRASSSSTKRWPAASGRMTTRSAGASRTISQSCRVNRPCATIVGVVGDVRHFAVERAAEPQMFVPHAQMPWPSMAVVLRSRLDAQALTREVRQTVWSVDGTLPVPPLRGLDDLFAGAVGQPRFRAWLLGLFGAMAVLLAMTGLYGTMAYSAQQHTREIGLRMALGATPQQATARLLRNGLTIAALGMMLGLAGSFAVARALSTMLFGVGTQRPGHVHRRTGVARAAGGSRLLPADASGAAARSAQGHQRELLSS